MTNCYAIVFRLQFFKLYGYAEKLHLQTALNYNLRYKQSHLKIDFNYYALQKAVYLL